MLKFSKFLFLFRHYQTFSLTIDLPPVGLSSYHTSVNLSVSLVSRGAWITILLIYRVVILLLQLMAKFMECAWCNMNPNWCFLGYQFGLLDHRLAKFRNIFLYLLSCIGGTNTVCATKIRFHFWFPWRRDNSVSFSLSVFLDFGLLRPLNNSEFLKCARDSGEFRTGIYCG